MARDVETALGRSPLAHWSVKKSSTISAYLRARFRKIVEIRTVLRNSMVTQGHGTV